MFSVAKAERRFSALEHDLLSSAYSKSCPRARRQKGASSHASLASAHAEENESDSPPLSLFLLHLQSLLFLQ